MSRQSTNEIKNGRSEAKGMSIEESKAYLAERGLESMVPGGFETLSKMQQKKMDCRCYGRIQASNNNTENINQPKREPARNPAGGGDNDNI